jgi:hypothetical protein
MNIFKRFNLNSKIDDENHKLNKIAKGIKKEMDLNEDAHTQEVSEVNKINTIACLQKIIKYKKELGKSFDNELYFINELNK